MKDDKNNLIYGRDDVSSAPTEEVYTRLEELMAGQKPKQVRRNDKIQLAVYRLLLAGVLGLMFWYQSRLPSYNHTRQANIIVKLILISDANNYLEENYPDTADDFSVNINNGVLSYKTGYMATCRDVDNYYSYTAIYYDKSMNVIRVAENLMPDIAIDN